ncbi:hypothetical protein SNEBB_010031 [Seison nebaliae]|nr:hypothetical protein SNEBB_010031 [Seison nebaliae]
MKNVLQCISIDSKLLKRYPIKHKESSTVKSESKRLPTLPNIIRRHFGKNKSLKKICKLDERCVKSCFGGKNEIVSEGIQLNEEYFNQPNGFLQSLEREELDTETNNSIDSFPKLSLDSDEDIEINSKKIQTESQDSKITTATKQIQTESEIKDYPLKETRSNKSSQTNKLKVDYKLQQESLTSCSDALPKQLETALNDFRNELILILKNTIPLYVPHQSPEETSMEHMKDNLVKIVRSLINEQTKKMEIKFEKLQLSVNESNMICVAANKKKKQHTSRNGTKNTEKSLNSEEMKLLLNTSLEKFGESQEEIIKNIIGTIQANKNSVSSKKQK